MDMHSCSDQAITLAAIAPFADGPVHITGISHIRLQESDRIAAIVENLTALGVKVLEEQDAVIIYPVAGNLQAAEIQTHDDHRLAMGFALVGLRSPGVTIVDPKCCRKTFENYFEVLEQVVHRIEGGAEEEVDEEDDSYTASSGSTDDEDTEWEANLLSKDADLFGVSIIGEQTNQPAPH